MKYFGTPVRGVLDKGDVRAMRTAFRLAVSDQSGTVSEVDTEALGRVVIKLYSMGLVEPEKLAAAAAVMATSKTFRSPDVTSLLSAAECVGGR